MKLLNKIFELLGGDWLGFTLNVFKLLGVTVSGFAGIVATAADKPNRPKKAPPKTRLEIMLKKPFTKQWALRWAVSGFMVAIVAQFLDTIKTTADQKDSAAQAAKQLDAISALVTKFKDVYATAVFELPNTSTIRNLAEELITNGPILSSSAIELNPLEPNIIRIKPASMAPSLATEWKPLIDYATKAQLSLSRIEINRRLPRESARESVISIENCFSNGDGVDLRYSLDTRRFHVYIGFKAMPYDTWQKPREVGISDLAGGKLILVFEQPRPAPRDPLVPVIPDGNLVRCELFFDNYPCTLSGFAGPSFDGKSFQYEATLPERAEILHYQASTKNPF
jgi:hypothetical protein